MPRSSQPFKQTPPAPSYDLLNGTPGGLYTIQAVYTDPVDFKTSTGTNQLSVTAAATTIALRSHGTSATIDWRRDHAFREREQLGRNHQRRSVTFTVFNGTTQIAGPFTLSVSNGLASGNVFLPAGTSIGSYTLQAGVQRIGQFRRLLPNTSTLTVSAASSSTAAIAASTQYRAASQTVPLSATVTSAAGTVNEGTVTFTILNGSNPVGTPVPASVSAGSASANYPLPAGTAIGTYTIRAVFTDTGDFLGSVDTSHSLTVTQPASAKLIVETPPSGTATAGIAFTTQPVIYEEDQNGNLETGDNSTVVTVSLASGAGPLQGTFTATVVGGIATFTNLGDNTAETITLKFSSGNLDTATTRRASSSAPPRPASSSSRNSRRPRRRPARPSPPSRSSRKRTSTATSSRATAPHRHRGARAPSERPLCRAPT